MTLLERRARLARRANRARSLSKQPASLSLDATRIWLSWPRMRRGRIWVVVGGVAVAALVAIAAVGCGFGGDDSETSTERVPGRGRELARPRRVRARKAAEGADAGGVPRRGWTRRRTRSTTPPAISTTSAPRTTSRTSTSGSSTSSSSSPPTSRGPPTRRASRASRTSSRAPRVSTSRAGTRSTRSWPSSAGRASRSTPSPVRRTG